MRGHSLNASDTSAYSSGRKNPGDKVKKESPEKNRCVRGI